MKKEVLQPHRRGVQPLGTGDSPWCGQGAGTLRTPHPRPRALPSSPGSVTHLCATPHVSNGETDGPGKQRAAPRQQTSTPQKRALQTSADIPFSVISHFWETKPLLRGSPISFSPFWHWRGQLKFTKPRCFLGNYLEADDLGSVMKYCMVNSESPNGSLTHESRQSDSRKRAKRGTSAEERATRRCDCSPKSEPAERGGGTSSGICDITQRSGVQRELTTTSLQLPKKGIMSLQTHTRHTTFGCRPRSM